MGSKFTGNVNWNRGSYYPGSKSEKLKAALIREGLTDPNTSVNIQIMNGSGKQKISKRPKLLQLWDIYKNRHGA